MKSRREFLKRASQLMMFSGLIGGSVYLVARNGISESCDDSKLCRNCSKLKNCGIEKAKKIREESKK